MTCEMIENEEDLENEDLEEDVCDLFGVIINQFGDL